MTPDRSYHKGLHKAEQYTWNYERVIYIDNHSFEGTWEEAERAVDKLCEKEAP